MLNGSNTSGACGCCLFMGFPWSCGSLGRSCRCVHKIAQSRELTAPTGAVTVHLVKRKRQFPVDTGRARLQSCPPFFFVCVVVLLHAQQMLSPHGGWLFHLTILRFLQNLEPECNRNGVALAAETLALARQDRVHQAVGKAMLCGPCRD